MSNITIAVHHGHRRVRGDTPSTEVPPAPSVTSDGDRDDQLEGGVCIHTSVLVSWSVDLACDGRAASSGGILNATGKRARSGAIPVRDAR